MAGQTLDTGPLFLNEVCMNQWTGALERYAQTLARQSGRLLATLATHDGARMRLDWLFDTVFVAAVDELAERGVPRRVAADMLGMSHRTLQRRYATAAEALQIRGRSVWTAIVEILRQGPVTRADVAARAGRVPPVVIASVLNNMVEAGWVEEQGDQLHLKVDASNPMTEAQVQAYVDIRRRAEPGVSSQEVAEELKISVEVVLASWNKSKGLLARAKGDNAWMAMERCAEAAFRLLQDTADDPESPTHSATIWRVRLDDKPPEFQEKLRRFIKQLNVDVEAMIKPVATDNDDDPEARFWVFTGFQTHEMD